MVEIAKDDKSVIVSYLDRAAALDVDGYMDLWAENGRLEMPYHPVIDARICYGLEAIRDRMVVARELVERVRFDDVVIRATEEAGTYVLEYASDGKMRGANPFHNRYCVIAQIGSGRVVLWREYFNPDVRTEALVPDSMGVDGS